MSLTTPTSGPGAYWKVSRQFLVRDLNRKSFDKTDADFLLYHRILLYCFQVFHKEDHENLLYVLKNVHKADFTIASYPSSLMYCTSAFCKFRRASRHIRTPADRSALPYYIERSASRCFPAGSARLSG